MKNEGCWVEGNFFYTPLHFEVLSIRAEVEGMPDYELVEEACAIFGHGIQEVDDVIDAFFSLKNTLSEEERDVLIWFYVVANIQDYLVLDDAGDW